MLASSTHTKTVVGVFDDFATAQRVAERLQEAGFSKDEIDVTSSQRFADDYREPSSNEESSGGGIAGFFRRLFGADDDTGTYAEAVRRGNAVVTVTADKQNTDRAADLMNELGAIDVDERVEAWKARGNTTYDPGAAPYSDDEAVQERGYYRQNPKDINDTQTEAGRSDYTGGNKTINETGDRNIPVVREELRVGKRAVNRGGVRVYNRIHEEPVQEQVRLREEHVRVDRRPADRVATEADIRGHDEVFEVTESAEEAVVDKQTRVVEEVVVSKDVTERVETINDTLRRSDVNVENLGQTDSAYRTEYDDEFRADFDRRYAAMPNARYETYAPAYQYGYRMASEDQYRGRGWDLVESDVRSRYEREYPDSKWEQMKEAVRHGWEKVTGRR